MTILIELSFARSRGGNKDCNKKRVIIITAMQSLMENIKLYNIKTIIQPRIRLNYGDKTESTVWALQSSHGNK